jgi:pyruvate kinase
MAERLVDPDPPGSTRAPDQWDQGVVQQLIDALTALRQELTALEADLHDRLGSVHPDHVAGATNLVHYIGLRRRDLRAVQERLAWIGLSSLGRSESHVLANLDKVLGLLHVLAGQPWQARHDEEPAGFRSAVRLLEKNTARLLGVRHQGTRQTRILVTLGAEAAHDYALVHALLRAGMDCARINCAHDDPQVWAAMLAHVARARRELGRECPVLMDLGGPKLRTGETEPGPAVLRWRPHRDALGRLVAPARIFLSPLAGASAPAGCDACFQVDSRWLERLAPGETIELVDARGARRILKIGETGAGGRWAEATQTAYVTNDTILRREPGRDAGDQDACTAGGIPSAPQVLILHRGDMLILTRDNAPGRPAGRDRPASIPCTLPQVFRQVRAGERVWLDDGRLGGVIRHVSQGEIHVEITAARDDGEKLGADKGINLPDSALDLPALTEKDLQDLQFVAAHADLVGLSFVQQPADIAQLQDELVRLGRPDLGIVLKIETRRAFEKLPDLLLAGMRASRLGVMIARGDLAVELGYERMAEVQEEILWLAESAHLPVIWATQVLESLAKRGQPSRAEITDAAMGERAECVMLNKGPHVLEAVRALDDILSRMEAHQHKKRAMLRQLHWWPAPPAKG